MTYVKTMAAASAGNNAPERSTRTPPPPPRPGSEKVDERTPQQSNAMRSFDKIIQSGHSENDGDSEGEKRGLASNCSAVSNASSSLDDSQSSFVPEHMNVEGALTRPSNGTHRSSKNDSTGDGATKEANENEEIPSLSEIQHREEASTYSTNSYSKVEKREAGSSGDNNSPNHNTASESKLRERAKHLPTDTKGDSGREPSSISIRRGSFQSNASQDSSITKKSYNKSVPWDSVLTSVREKGEGLDQLQIRNIAVESPSGGMPIELPKMRHLVKIELVNVSMDMKRVSSRWISKCHGLKELAMRQCGLTSLPPIDDAKSLALLDVRENSITDTTMSRAPSLSVVLLSNNSIKRTIDLRPLSILTSLRVLDLFPNPVYGSNSAQTIKTNIRAYLPLLETLDGEKLVFNSPEVRKRNRPMQKKTPKLSGEKLKNSVSRLSTPNTAMRFRMEETHREKANYLNNHDTRSSVSSHSSKSLNQEQLRSVLRLSCPRNTLRLENESNQSTRSDEPIREHDAFGSIEYRSFRRPKPGEKWVFGRPVNEPQRLEINSPSVVTVAGSYPLFSTGKTPNNSLRSRSTQYKSTGSFFNLQAAFEEEKLSKNEGSSAPMNHMFYNVTRELEFPHPDLNSQKTQKDRASTSSSLAQHGAAAETKVQSLLQTEYWRPTITRNTSPTDAVTSTPSVRGPNLIEDIRLERWHESAREVVVSLGLILEYALEQILIYKASIVHTLQAAMEAAESIQIDITGDVIAWVDAEMPVILTNTLKLDNMVSHVTSLRNDHLTLALLYYGYLVLFNYAFRALNKKDLNAVIRIYGVLESSHIWKLLKTEDMKPQELGMTHEQIVGAVFAQIDRFRDREK